MSAGEADLPAHQCGAPKPTPGHFGFAWPTSQNSRWWEPALPAYAPVNLNRHGLFQALESGQLSGSLPVPVLSRVSLEIAPENLIEASIAGSQG